MLKAKPFTLMLIASLIVLAITAYGQTPGCCGKGMDMEGKDAIHKPCNMPGGPGGKDHKPMIPDLTDEQKEKIETLKVEHMGKMLPLKNEMGEKQARLQTLTTAEKVNMSEVNKLIDNIGALCTKIMKLQAQHRQDVRELLTDKQRLIFDAQEPGMGGCMGGKGNMHHPGPK
ncbi:hypothetical protein A2Y85_01880 [candidate division WOR-3 bacterium RBG_13_43_14]|uniref:Periplasmic heavy metal sensor n=1 Tax=candidate division WOR-3 bacterium RBG_13_43_14 TaxID=1802590 RepID=A0A1F4UFF1_UNCW3|nr:MAG: hypothetical protein A2Y85_01880 [candidate division WOR-3 bacterium RBG_13_43_14]